MKDGKEIERKFLFRNFSPTFVPEEGAVAQEIVQDYLIHKGPGARRVRKQVTAGIVSYFYTEKEPTDEPGTQIERERQITQAEYETLLQERDPALKTIEKIRYRFVQGGKTYELDVFNEPRPLVMLEVELDRHDEPVEIPEDWKVEEVTGNPEYFNRAIAQA